MREGLSVFDRVSKSSGHVVKVHGLVNDTVVYAVQLEGGCLVTRVKGELAPLVNTTIPVTKVQVGMYTAGGEVIAVRLSKSGKTIFVTTRRAPDSAPFEDRISTATRCAVAL